MTEIAFTSTSEGTDNGRVVVQTVPGPDVPPLFATVERVNAGGVINYVVTFGAFSTKRRYRSRAMDEARDLLRDEVNRWRDASRLRAGSAGPDLTGVRPDMLLDIITANLTELRRQIEADAAPQPDSSLPDLRGEQDELTKRIIRRASYDTLKAMLSVLDGWIEGNRENNDSMGRRDCGPGDTNDPERFLAADIRTMVNDTARIMGTNEPYNPFAELAR